MKKSLMLLVMALALAFAGLANAAEERTDIPLDRSPSLGPGDAPVTIVEFLDYQ